MTMLNRLTHIRRFFHNMNYHHATINISAYCWNAGYRSGCGGCGQDFCGTPFALHHYLMNPQILENAKFMGTYESIVRAYPVLMLK